MEEQHKKWDYTDAQEKLMRYFELKFPPVVVSLIRHKEQIPEGVKELEKPMFYCAMVKYAMLGNVFYAREALHASLFDSGGRTENWISPPRQVCAYATARPYQSGELNLTIACESARMAAHAVGCEYLDETVLVGLPAEMLGTVLKNGPRIGYVKARLGKSEGK